jgi:hypothetical protein
VFPGPSFLQLGGQAEESGFIAEASDEMDAYRKSFLTPIKWNRHGWLPGCITEGCKGNKLSGASPSFQRIIRGGVESSQRYGWLTKSRCHENIIIQKKGGNFPRNLLQCPDGKKIIRGSELLSQFIQTPG